ncbi:hypothetical protein ACVNF4_36545, partial [Streptomyces sp. S6]
LYRGRPRGIVSAGVEEPNALIQLAGSYSEGMLPATTTSPATSPTRRSPRSAGVGSPRRSTSNAASSPRSAA